MINIGMIFLAGRLLPLRYWHQGSAIRLLPEDVDLAEPD
jgi:hypothetical protein